MIQQLSYRVSSIPPFAELKLWPHSRRFRLRGLLKVNLEALLKATGQNIQPLLKTKTPGKLLNPAQTMAVIPCPYLKFFASLIPSLIFNTTFSTLWTVFLAILTIVQSVLIRPALGLISQMTQLIKKSLLLDLKPI